MKSETREAPYRCSECGSVQQVTEIVNKSGVYAGSRADFCDKCGGVPLSFPVDAVRVAFTDDDLRIMRDALAAYEQGTLGRDKSIAAQLLVVLGAVAEMPA